MSTLKFDVNGREFPVEVSRSGDFSTTLDGETVRADTLKKLKEKVAAQLRTLVAIPATVMVEEGWRFEDKAPTFQDVILTGIDQHRHLRGREDKKGAKSEIISGQPYKRLTADDKKRLVTLWRAKRDAEKAYMDACTELRLDYRTEIEKASILQG